MPEGTPGGSGILLRTCIPLPGLRRECGPHGRRWVTVLISDQCSANAALGFTARAVHLSADFRPAKVAVWMAMSFQFAGKEGRV